MILLSATGTLDTILILIIVWQILRLFVRAQEHNGAIGHRSSDNRSQGEVRIERANDERRTDRNANVQDADFEEIN